MRTTEPSSVRVRRAVHDRGARCLFLLLIALLAACEPLQRPAELADSPAARQAAALAGQGRHDDAAEAYLALAAESAGVERERYLILAARQRRLGAKLGAAHAILESLPQPVDELNRLGWAQVAGDLAVARGRPRRALEILALAPPTSDPGAAAELQRIRAEALFRLDDPVAATRAYLERAIWLDDAVEIAANQRMLWAAYQRWGESIDPERIAGIEDPVLSGWLELGRIAATRRDTRAGLGLALTAWSAKFPTHPAADVLLPALLRDFRGTAVMPDRLALLLPLSGRQRAAGTALREGFLAAHFRAAGLVEDPPVIRIYDVDAAGVQAAQQAALNDGAQFMVGPLLKESVQALAEAGVEVPTLALNYLPDDQPAPPGLYQFALVPEDEAVAAAQRALATRRHRAIALVPNNPFGRRLLNSFADAYTARGGQILDYRFFDPDSPDFSRGIRQLLLIDESRERYRRLDANLGIDLGFEPRRRDDVDLIFLGAGPDSGKLIRPQLKFYYAGGIPTYATSIIYQEGSRNNADLDGVMFADMPWVVEPDAEIRAVRDALGQLWPDGAARHARLFAMGFDAYRLVPELAGGGMSTHGELSGATGRLYFAADGRIHRRLVWARVRGGRPVRLEAGLDEPAPAAEAGSAPVPRRSSERR